MARILIIDDEEIIRDYLRVILEDNHIIHEARDGGEGIDLYRKHFFDLVITDILMPARDGIEVIVEITDSFPDARIIAISGGGRGLEASFNLEMAKKCGAMRVLKKPFFPEDMRIAVSDVLTQQRDMPPVSSSVSPALDQNAIRLPHQCAQFTQKALASTSKFLHAIFPSSAATARGRGNEGKRITSAPRNMGS
ncbi:MAG: response regulator [Magnetococcales bacterium]|nr:response regulator [Magnetococcales bacterium]